MCAELDALQDVGWVTHGGGEHLGIEVVVGPSVHDFSDELHAVMARVVDASDERRDIPLMYLFEHK